MEALEKIKSSKTIKFSEAVLCCFCHDYLPKNWLIMKLEFGEGRNTVTKYACIECYVRASKA